MEVTNFDIDFAKFLMDNHSNESFLKKLAPNNISPNRSITLEEVHNYFTSKEHIVNVEVHQDEIEFFYDKLVQININIGQNTETISVSGDVALIQVVSDVTVSTNSIIPVDFSTLYDVCFMNNYYASLDVSKIGATTGVTEGYISRPAHVRVVDDSLLFKAKYENKSVPNMILKIQFIIRGSNWSTFGRPGDSGALVYVDNNDGTRTGVGIFVGGNAKTNIYVATPIEFVTSLGYTFI